MESMNRKRGAIKAKLTKTQSDIETLDVTANPIEIFEEYLSRLQDTSAEFTNVKNDILKKIDDLEDEGERSAEEIKRIYDEQLEKFADIDDQMVRLKSSLRAKINVKKALNHLSQSQYSRNWSTWSTHSTCSNDRTVKPSSDDSSKILWK
jgi:hypothetical protein